MNDNIEDPQGERRQQEPQAEEQSKWTQHRRGRNQVKQPMSRGNGGRLAEQEARQLSALAAAQFPQYAPQSCSRFWIGRERVIRSYIFLQQFRAGLPRGAQQKA